MSYWSAKGWPFLRAHPINGGVAPDELQIAALTIGTTHDKFGYFFEQGLAKTVTDLAHFIYTVQTDQVDAHIIIAPTYLKSGWADECALWQVGVPVILWPDRIDAATAKKPHIMVFNYEAMLSSGGRYLEELLASGVRYSVTLDESSSIKNLNGTLSKKVRYLTGDVIVRRALSGTPMTQDVMDLWAQLRFLGQLNGVNPFQFRNRYAKLGGFMGKKVVGVNEEWVGELHQLLDTCTFRALKRDWWADAPEKIYEQRQIEMTPVQLGMYKSMLNEFYLEVLNNPAIFADQVIHMKSKLLQISRGFIIDTENDAVRELVPPAKNPALRVLKETLDTIPGKWIIFCTRTYSVDMLAEQLKDRGIVVMRGGMKTKEITAIKHQFNNDPDIRGMVAMSSVGAKGHTLLGTATDRCSTSIYWENDYNLETRLQSEDRNHRRGQDRNVLYIDFFCSPEDKAINRSLQTKGNLVEAIVNAVRKHPEVRWTA